MSHVPNQMLVGKRDMTNVVYSLALFATAPFPEKDAGAGWSHIYSRKSTSPDRQTQI